MKIKQTISTTSKSACQTKIYLNLHPQLTRPRFCDDSLLNSVFYCAREQDSSLSRHFREHPWESGFTAPR